jgi:uncharacterized protein (DUF1778 family)
MRVAQTETTSREALNIRIKPEVRGLIDRAAALAGKNRTDLCWTQPAARPRRRFWIERFLP